jgi:hypothetical protein
MPQTLPCENGAGSINNPNGSAVQTGLNNPALAPYIAPSLPSGEWELNSINPDLCEQNDQLRQETYVAEALRISGAPINLYKLLGVHEQGTGSILSEGSVIASMAYPGFPITGINSTSWKSFQTGAAVAANAYVGIDFGIKRLVNLRTEYAPEKAKWTKVGALQITQANTPNEFARQVKVEIADGSCEVIDPLYSGLGNGSISFNGFGPNATRCTVSIVAISSSAFTVHASMPDGSTLQLNNAFVGVPFLSTIINVTLEQGVAPFAIGDMFTIAVNYVWKRIGIFNLVQSPLPQTLGFKTPLTVKAVRIVPTLFQGSGNWEVLALDVLDSAPTDINNIQDLFFNENRDRDYSVEPILMKMQYSPADSMSDLSRFGLSILDSYSFTVSFVTMVQQLGRPIIVGDIVEVIPEMQYDHNLKPVRKFLEVTDTGWASEGFSTTWRPTVYRFSASQATPSQENRDIFGTIDSQKYLIADSVLNNGVADQIDVMPLASMEEIMKEAADAVPERGSDDGTTMGPVPYPVKPQSSTPKGNPPPQGPHGTLNGYIEDGLPKGGEPYGEGYALPDLTTAHDGDFFRLNYAPHLNIAPRLYRYSMVKNKWLYLETDRRADYSSHKPSVRNILQSATKQSINKKTV